MSKQYGLILPGQQKKPAAPPPSREVSKPSIFDESSDSDREAPPALKTKSAPIASSAMERRLARRQQEKALAEDPTIFQYDEHFDEMEAQREHEKEVKSKEPKKPKYIGRLLEHAERRKLENERRVERQVQLEREQEGDEFKDKESFVTTAYRNKIEELRQLEQQEKRDDYLESIGDVTKQRNLDGFYRFLYEQKTGATKEVKKPELPPSAEADKADKDKDDDDEDDDKELSYKPIKSVKPQTQRAYRKRHSSAELEADEDDKDANKTAKKVHLTNNIDADSDFSIDSSSSSDEEDEKEGGDKKKEENDKKEVDTKDDKKTKETAANEKKSDEKKAAEKELKVEEIEQPMLPALPPPPKRDKSEIWKKRTVGEVFDAAVKRYYERKAARSA